jgi:hypothetical protein
MHAVRAARVLEAGGLKGLGWFFAWLSTKQDFQRFVLAATRERVEELDESDDGEDEVSDCWSNDELEDDDDDDEDDDDDDDDDDVEAGGFMAVKLTVKALSAVVVAFAGLVRVAGVFVDVVRVEGVVVEFVDEVDVAVAVVAAAVVGTVTGASVGAMDGAEVVVLGASQESIGVANFLEISVMMVAFSVVLSANGEVQLSLRSLISVRKGAEKSVTAISVPFFTTSR